MSAAVLSSRSVSLGAMASDANVLGQHMRRTRAPREMKVEDWPALSAMASGLSAALARWSGSLHAPKVETDARAKAMEEEAPAWELEAASRAVSAFCATHPATRVEPLAHELESLWRRCASLRRAAVSEALAAEFVCEGGDIDWRRLLRALHVLNYLFARGDAGAAAARPAAEDSEGLIRHLVGHVPQCAAQASRALRTILGEAGDDAALGGRSSGPSWDDASAPEDTPLQPPAAAPGPGPATVAAASVPRLSLPRLPSTSVPAARPRARAADWTPILRADPAPVAAAVFGDFDWVQAWDEEATAKCDSEAGSTTDESVQASPLSSSEEEEDLGFHWLEKSRIDSAVPKAADPFAHLAMAAGAVAGAEGL